MQPGVEPVRIAECPQVTPGDHQRVLYGILGPIDVSQDPLRDPEEPVTAHADQVGVCLPVPVPCRLDEITIHCGPSGWCPAGTPSDTLWESARRKCSNGKPDEHGHDTWPSRNGPIDPYRDGRSGV